MTNVVSVELWLGRVVEPLGKLALMTRLIVQDEDDEDVELDEDDGEEEEDVPPPGWSD